LEELPRIGIADMHPVDGAFYIYADVARFTNDSIAFCKRMLDRLLCTGHAKFLWK